MVGQWVFGGIQRGSRQVFMKCVPDRTYKTLSELIVKYVKEGYTHLTVNHSLHIVDPDTGVHTNFIESTWSCKSQFTSTWNNQKHV